MSGGAGGGSPARASPTARSGLGRSDSGSRMSFQCWRATAVAFGAVVGAWRPRRRCPWRRLGRCSGPSAPDTPERGECAVMGAVPGVPGHRPHAQEQSLFQSAPYFGHGGRVTTRMRCLPRAAGSSARAPPTPGRPPPQSNAQAWESDERRRNRHAAAPSTHPGGAAAASCFPAKGCWCMPSFQRWWWPRAALAKLPALYSLHHCTPGASFAPHSQRFIRSTTVPAWC